MRRRSKLARRYGHFQSPAIVRKHPELTAAVLGAGLAVAAPAIQAAAGIAGVALVGAVSAAGIRVITDH